MTTTTVALYKALRPLNPRHPNGTRHWIRAGQILPAWVPQTSLDHYIRIGVVRRYDVPKKEKTR